MTTLGKVTPILRSFDDAKARELYIDFLGFKVDWDHRFEPDLRCTCKSPRTNASSTSPNTTATADLAPRSESPRRVWLLTTSNYLPSSTKTPAPASKTPSEAHAKCASATPPEIGCRSLNRSSSRWPQNAR
jgi:hypothetical protein